MSKQFLRLFIFPILAIPISRLSNYRVIFLSLFFSPRYRDEAYARVSISGRCKANLFIAISFKPAHAARCINSVGVKVNALRGWPAG